MGTVGFLNLPKWHGLLRKTFAARGFDDLLCAPVLGSEEVDPPWISLEPDEFFPVVETGFHFSDNRTPVQWPNQVVTSDPLSGFQRIRDGKHLKTGVRGAIGGTYPILDICNPQAGYSSPRRLLTMTDGVAGAVLSEMEHSGSGLELAMKEIQWKNLAPSNSTRHIHGLIARERLALLGALLFRIILDPEQIHVDGFGGIESRDMVISKNFQMTVRLLGVVEKQDQKFSAWVRPVLMPSRYLLAQVRGGAEAAYLQMDDGSSFFFSGSGTSPEVILRGMLWDWKILSTGETGPASNFRGIDLVPYENLVSGFYLRLALLNFETTVSSVLNILAAKGVGIRALFQPDAAKDTIDKDGEPELVILTRPVREVLIQETLRGIRENVRLASVKACYRLEG